MPPAVLLLEDVIYTGFKVGERREPVEDTLAERRCGVETGDQAVG